MRRTIYVCLLCLAVSFLSQAQHYEHLTLWTRFSVQKKITSKFDIAAEYIWRRQSDFRSDKSNPMAMPLATGYRLNFIYRAKNWNYSLMNWLVRNNALYAKMSDFNRPDRWEIRPSFFAEWNHPLSKKWSLRLRGGYEYRFFKRDDDTWGDEQGRIRFRIQGRYNFNAKNMLLVHNEILYNFPPNVPANTFSQNQSYLGLQHNFTPHLSSEIGYIYNYRQRASLVEFDEENILQANLYIRF